ncbi:hypothetical protein BX666DRAFT_1890584 [Dichotomocladium elegans]|nr:hypothetical protein BX666DRAFT_1890584 [Dichotomocladium elegans]
MNTKLDLSANASSMFPAACRHFWFLYLCGRKERERHFVCLCVCMCVMAYICIDRSICIK